MTNSKLHQYDLESKAYTTTGVASAYELTIQKLKKLLRTIQKTL